MRRTVWGEVVGPAVLYAAAVSLLGIFASGVNARLGVRTGPWYVELLSVSVIFGVPLAWTQLFAQRSCLPWLTARLVLGWMIALPLVARFVGQDPLTAVPGHPLRSFVVVAMGCVMVGFLCAGVVAVLVVAAQFGRRVLRRASNRSRMRRARITAVRP